jgi:gamma-glutamyltranspeptidase / glutathione hydrolase
VFLYATMFGYNAEYAVELPRFQSEHLVESFDNHAMKPGGLLLDERTPADVVAELKRRGHIVEMRSRYQSGSAPVFIRLNPSGLIEAGADPYYFRSAQSW